MRLTIDTEKATLTSEGDGQTEELPLYSRESFEKLSLQWTRVGWAMRYYFTFSWFGRPVLQMPEDLLRLQEVIFELQPDVIVETGIYNGGSLLFHASLCEAMGKGRVVGVDKFIDNSTRQFITQHRLGPRISMIEGNSVASETVAEVRGKVGAAERVMVILDSYHSRDHVAAELDAYASFVSAGSWLLVADGIMRDLADVPGGSAEWSWDNPTAAATDFAQRHPEFEQRTPLWPFNESSLKENVTYCPQGWLWRKHDA